MKSSQFKGFGILSSLTVNKSTLSTFLITNTMKTISHSQRAYRILILKKNNNTTTLSSCQYSCTLKMYVFGPLFFSASQAYVTVTQQNYFGLFFSLLLCTNNRPHPVYSERPPCRQESWKIFLRAVILVLRRQYSHVI